VKDTVICTSHLTLAIATL